jgi:hypothetical protein
MMTEQELQDFERRFATRGPRAALELCAEIRRLRMLLSPPAPGVVVTQGVGVPVHLMAPMIEENAQIGEAWSSEAPA